LRASTSSYNAHQASVCHARGVPPRNLSCSSISEQLRVADILLCPPALFCSMRVLSVAAFHPATSLVLDPRWCVLVPAYSTPGGTHSEYYHLVLVVPLSLLDPRWCVLVPAYSTPTRTSILDTRWFVLVFRVSAYSTPGGTCACGWCAYSSACERASTSTHPQVIAC
jgi:hypothetical protein